MKRLLLGYDGSESAERALLFAIDLAQRFGAELHVLTVARPPEFGDDVEVQASLEHSRRHSETLLVRAKHRVGGSLSHCRYQTAVGHPAEQLIRYAEEHQVDHIVVGHRGHTLFERWLIGSIARQVIAYAHCAVTVLR